MTDGKSKPVLDEQTFEKLLEAGYVLQEHNRKMRELEQNLESQSEQLRERDLLLETARQKSKQAEESSRPDSDYTLTLAEIVEAQHQIQMRHLELDRAMAVVADRVARITGATGAGIGILEGATVRYRAGSGSPSLPVGTEVPLQSAICQANIRTGQVIRTDDVDTEFLFDPEPCRQRGILSLVAVPIYHDSNIVGALELYFDRLHGYAEQDIHTCQLMAGLVTEAISADADSRLKKSMAAERSTMLAAIERLQPNLAALAESSPPSVPVGNAVASSIAVKSPCWKCGNQLLAEEQFCGKCGAPRVGDSEPASLQSKLASAWHMTGHDQLTAESANGSSGVHAKTQAATGYGQGTQTAGKQIETEDDAFSLPHLNRGRSVSALNAAGTGEDEDLAPVSEPQIDEEIGEPATALAKPRAEGMVWSSAAKAREFLESVSSEREPGAVSRFWRNRRGDIYLAIAVILVIVVIRWGVWSNPAAGAHGRATSVTGRTENRKQPVAENDLSALDKFLIAFGLAEPPEAPENKGNPDTQVWVDLQSAQYYCPGADLYGKTPKGKVTSQRDAQLDQFEPAYRKACE